METKKRLAIKSTMRYTIHLKAKSNQSIGGDDYFFALLTSLPSIYPAPPQTAMRAIKAS